MEEKTISLSDLSSYRLVSKKDWEKIEKLARELSQERNMWKEKYEELNERHLTLCDDHHLLTCAYYGYMQVVCAHGIDPKEVKAAMDEYERGGVCGCRKAMVETPYLDPDEEREFYEDDYPGWGNTFENAAQKSSREEWEEGAKKAEEQTKSEDATIEDNTLDVLRTKLQGRHASITPLGFDGATSEEVVFESISSKGIFYVIVWRCRGKEGFYKLRFHQLAIWQLGYEGGLLIGRSESYPETKFEVVVRRATSLDSAEKEKAEEQSNG